MDTEQGGVSSQTEGEGLEASGGSSLVVELSRTAESGLRQPSTETNRSWLQRPATGMFMEGWD